MVKLFFVPTHVCTHTQRWIRVSLRDKIIIDRLYLVINPADSSYTPVEVAVSYGEEIGALSPPELMRISFGARNVLLLSNMAKVGVSCKLMNDTGKYIFTALSLRTH